MKALTVGNITFNSSKPLPLELLPNWIINSKRKPKQVMKKLPSSLKLIWHKEYKKDYPKEDQVYLVRLQPKNKSNKVLLDFAMFIKEKFAGHNYDRWEVSINWFLNPFYVSSNHIYIRKGDNNKVKIIEWAEIEVKQNGK